MLPVGPDLPHAVCGFRSLIRNLLHLAELPQAAFASSLDRAMNMPAHKVTLQELYDAVVSVVKDPTKLGKISFQPDATLEAKLRTFHSNMDSTRARSLGMVGESSIAAIAADFAAEFLTKDLLKPVVELYEEPRHCCILSNNFVRVYHTDFAPGDTTLLHAHRVHSIYFFFSGAKVGGQRLGEEVVEDCMEPGEIRYGDHSNAALIHCIHCRRPGVFCLDVELASFKNPSRSPAAKKPRCDTSEPYVVDGLQLVKDRPGARVYVLRLAPGRGFEAELPFARMLWIVFRGSHVTGFLGDVLLLPAQVFYREGPERVTLENSKTGQELVMWVIELRE